jgi:hypothetical protein
MAKKELTRIEIICKDNKECTVDISGDRKQLIAALASLIADDNEENEFNELIHVAMSVVMFAKKLDMEESKPKKKAAPKKKK